MCRCSHVSTCSTETGRRMRGRETPSVGRTIWFGTRRRTWRLTRTPSYKNSGVSLFRFLRCPVVAFPCLRLHSFTQFIFLKSVPLSFASTVRLLLRSCCSCVVSGSPSTPNTSCCRSDAWKGEVAHTVSHTAPHYCSAHCNNAESYGRRYRTSLKWTQC